VTVTPGVLYYHHYFLKFITELIISTVIKNTFYNYLLGHFPLISFTNFKNHNFGCYREARVWCDGGGCSNREARKRGMGSATRMGKRGREGGGGGYKGVGRVRRGLGLERRGGLPSIGCESTAQNSISQQSSRPQRKNAKKRSTVSPR
jgi:hypothetical protein